MRLATMNVWLWVLVVACLLMASNADEIPSAEATGIELDNVVEESVVIGEVATDKIELDNYLKVASSEATLDENADLKTELENTTDETNKTKGSPVTCNPRVVNETVAVKLVNSSVLLSIIIPESNITANECVLVMFYAPWCSFSASAAPHYNALARVFPTVYVLALNAIKHHSLNTRYGTVAVPTVMLFHNGRPITKYNDTAYTLEKFVKFVTKYTGLQPEGVVNVTSADFEGPLPSKPVKETDYLLWISWIFVILCCILSFVKSPMCHYILECIRSNWLEAEAQHEHED